MLSPLKEYIAREREPWPAPRPLAGALAKVCAFDPELLPAALQAWVLDVAERLQVPPDYPAATLLVMLAGALGRRALIRPQRYDNWVVIPNLWGAIIGRSGVMKSAVLRMVLGPLRHSQALAMAIYESERDAYQIQLPSQKQRRKLRTAAATHDGPRDAIADGQVLPTPVCTRYLVNEATIEKVHMILKENPHGLLYLRDELSGWIAQLEQRGHERDRAFFLETWDGDGEFTFDRVGRGTVHTSNLCLSVLGGLQPARLEQYLTAAVTGGSGDDGFIQRFQLLVWPDVEPSWEHIDRPPDRRAERRVEEILNRLLQISPEDPFRGRFSAAAQELFAAWRTDLERKIRGGDLPPALESHLAKSRSLLPKLALIFHASQNGGEEEIPLIEAQRAANFCAYLETHARRVYGCVASLPLRLAATLGQQLRMGRLANRFSLGDVYLHGWAGLDTPERARVAINVLVDAQWLRPSFPAAGRKTSVAKEYLVNPAVFSG